MRKERDRPFHFETHSEPTRKDRRTARSSSREETCVRLEEKEMEKVRGNEISMIFQEPMTSLNPVFTIGDQIMEAILFHQGLDKSGGPKKGH